MTKTLCLDAPTGLAGDMLSAVLLDLGAPWQEIYRYLQRLPVPDWQVEIKPTERGGLSACLFSVTCPPQTSARHLAEIEENIRQAAFPPQAEKLALTAFAHLAEAEAAAHGCRVQQVHFHEVGAVDAMIDICTVALAVTLLEIQQVYIGLLPWSRGTVRCAHGLLPTPAPAVRRLLQGYQFCQSDLEGELITPTGAALLLALEAQQQPMPMFTLGKSGCGAGHKELAQPNLLHGVLTEEADSGEAGLLRDQVAVLTANLDDASGELLGNLWSKISGQPVLDLSFSPLLMKKGRPGWQVTVIVAPGAEEAVAGLLLAETSTIGLRIHRENRLKLPRRQTLVDTRFGQIAVKLAGNTVAPEYESVKNAAERSGMPFKEVYLAAVAGALSRETAENGEQTS